jgi:ribosomal protein S30
VEVEGDFDNCYDTPKVKGKVLHQVVPRSPVKDVYQARLGVSDYNLESPAAGELVQE